MLIETEQYAKKEKEIYYVTHVMVVGKCIIITKTKRASPPQAPLGHHERESFTYQCARAFLAFDSSCCCQEFVVLMGEERRLQH